MAFPDYNYYISFLLKILVMLSNFILLFKTVFYCVALTSLELRGLSASVFDILGFSVTFKCKVNMRFGFVNFGYLCHLFST